MPTTTTRLGAFLQRRLSPTAILEIEGTLQHLHKELQAKQCPLASQGHVKQQELVSILCEATRQSINTLALVSLSNPLHRPVEISDRQYERLVMEYLEKSLPSSVKEKLSECLSGHYWPQIKDILGGDDTDELNFAILDEFGDTFRKGLGLKTGPQFKWLAPDTPPFSPDTLLDLLWDSFHQILFYHIGLTIADRQAALCLVNPLVYLLPHIIPLGTCKCADKKVWIIPCK